MHASWKSFGWFSAATIAAYALVAALGFFMPLQNDEISGLFLNHRAWQDGQFLINLLPQCGKEAFSQPLPWIWYVPAFLSYLTYGQIENPLEIRIIGIAQFLIWLALWTAIAMRLFAAPRRRWWVALALMLGFIGWDSLPLALLINRPEQTLLIGAGTAVALAVYAETLSHRPTARTFATLAMILAVLCTHASHPKSIALLPLELIMYGIFVLRAWRSRLAAAIAVLATAWIAIESYTVWLARLQCPGSATANAFYLSLHIPLQMLWQAPLEFLAKAAKNLLMSLASNFYLDNYSYISRVWLPISLQPLNDFARFLIYLLDIDAWLVHLLFLFAALGIFLRQLSGRSKSEPILQWGLGAILAFLIAIFILMTEGIFYVVALTIPLILLASLLAFGIVWKQPWKNTLAVKLAIVLLCGSILNQGLLLYRYADFLHSTEAFAQPPFNPDAFTPTFGYKQKRSDIHALARQCRIGTDKSTRHVALDELTYHSFRHTYQPLFFVDSTWGCCHKAEPDWFSLKNYLQLLRDYGSDGVIARCSLFPVPLRALATERGGFCCIPKFVMENNTE